MVSWLLLLGKWLLNQNMLVIEPKRTLGGDPKMCIEGDPVSTER